MNGGSCKELEDEKYVCHCSQDYTGDHCELGLYLQKLYKIAYLLRAFGLVEILCFIVAVNSYS